MERKGERLEMEGRVSVTISRNIEDREWDDFVEFEAEGQFEQTSRWAQVKGEAGWDSLRVLVRQNEKMVAGAQVLVRRIPVIGFLGYLPKGPLAPDNHSNLAPVILKKVKEVMKEHRIQCLIAQPPNDGLCIEQHLLGAGFKQERLLEVINATAVIDLTQSLDALMSKMTRNFRYNIRFAERNGVVVREGGEEDISSFFQMMLETCRRQGVRPNPSRESLVRKLWGLFHPKGNMEFFLAECRGKVISGLICIPFGKVFYAWKMGWTGEHEKSRANHLLHLEAIRWAKNKGYRLYDFMAVGRKVAEAVIGGAHFYQVAKGPDLFKLSFGGEVRLLPEAWYYIKNPFLRFMYKEIYPTLRKMRMIRSSIEGG